jgi:ABC-2 type transport system ATP-binding protein
MPSPAPSSPGASAGGIVVRGVEKAFGGQRVLGPVDLDAAAGSVTIATGDNGAGKTTLLRILATSLTADAGTATVNGLDVHADGARVRERVGVALVNERSLFWRLSARRNLDLFARIRGVPRAQRREHVAQLIREVDLEAHADKAVQLLSSGQRQRVVLARALVGDPAVLLVDEPLRGLDRTATDRILALLRSRADHGATVLIAAPESERLVEIADVTLRLEVQVEPPPPRRAAADDDDEDGAPW